MPNNDIRYQLQSHLDALAPPFLFMGTGISRRYVGLANWRDLLTYFAQMTDAPFEYYYATADGDLAGAATEIAKRFHHVWWTDGRFAPSRDKWAAAVSDQESALRIEVSEYLRHQMPETLPTEGPLGYELSLFQDVVVDGIVTTNYDQFLERMFPGYNAYIGQDELLFSAPQGIAEIYKIHGCVTRPDTIVLTRGDYDRFQQRNAYLAAKLLTIFVEHPVIFMGYSLGDSNVQGILRSIVNGLTEDNVDQLQDRLIFVKWAESEQPSMAKTSLMIEGIPVPIVQVSVPDFAPIFEALTSLDRRLPAKVLRQLKERVYELVQSNDPEGRLHVVDIDDPQAEDVEVVFGVGIKQSLSNVGYRGLRRWELMDDIIYDNFGLDPERVLWESVPGLTVSNAYVPVYKYLRGAGFFAEDGGLEDLSGLPSVIDFQATRDLHVSEQHRGIAQRTLARVQGIRELEEQQGADAVLNYGMLLEDEKVVVEELRDFLKRHVGRRNEGAWWHTQWGKLVCWYDRLAYGNP